MNNVQIILEGVDNATGVISGVGGALEGLGGIAKGVLSVGLAAGAAGFAALGAGLAFSVKEAIGAQEAQASLAQVIKSTGGIAGLTQEAANALAMQFRDLAGGSDEAILAIQEIGLRAGTITAEEMPAFIKVTADLGKVLGSTTQAAELLARAEEDPLAAMSKLQRAGIIFSASLKDQIKKLTDEGKVAEATALVLQRVGDATEGAASAGAETFAGRLEILQNHLAEVGETVGNAVLPLIETLFRDVIEPMIPFIEDAGMALAGFIEALTSGDIGGAFDVLTEFDSIQALMKELGISAEQVWAFGGMVEDAFANMPATIDGVVEALQPIIDGFTNLAGAIIESWPTVKATLEEMGTTLKTTFEAISPEIIENIGGILDQLAAFWRNHGETVMGIVSVLWNGIVLTIGGALTLLSGLVESALLYINGIFDSYSLVFQGNWKGAWDTIVLATSLAILNMLTAFDVFFESILLVMGTSLVDFRKQWQNNWDMLIIIVAKGIEGVINTINSFATQLQMVGTAIAQNIEIGITMYIAQILNTVKKMITDVIGVAGTTLGGFVGAGMPVAAGGLPGFANGGSFTVGGSGGTDSQVVAFRATPGEQVSISNGSGGGGMFAGATINLNNGMDIAMLAAEITSIQQGRG